jgi:hypothetical protein
MSARYNPPPNWPRPPDGWTPPPGWEPDPSWGPAPYGWQLWIEDTPRRRLVQRRHLVIGVGFVVGVASLLGYVYSFAKPSDDVTTTLPELDITDATAGPSTEAPTPDTTARQEPAPYHVSPHPTPTPPPRAYDGLSGDSGSRSSERDTAPEQRPDPEPTPSNDHADDTPRPWPPQPRWPRFPGSDDLDPRFESCEAARAAGYGPYRFDQDVEYYWYDDHDRDGVVCD